MTDGRTALFAFDKFRGTASSARLGEIGVEVSASAGWSAHTVPLADGGEGSLEVLGGANKTTTVTGPLGHPVEAAWRLDGTTAYIEMAAASGLILAGGSEGNDPLSADTTGTGELIAAAVKLGAREVVVFLGGSATTDGGWGAIEALPSRARLKEIDLRVACDVETRFVDAARVFGPQKGASLAQIKLLTRRLERLVDVYQSDYGLDVGELVGAGAAGGLAGGLAAVGARLDSGFEILADQVRLDEALARADVVITGEGKLDEESFGGKVVGGVHRWARQAGVPTVAIVGRAEDDVTIPDGLTVRSLAANHGLEAAMERTEELVAAEIAATLADH